MRNIFVFSLVILFALSTNVSSQTSSSKALVSDSIDVLHYDIHLDIAHQYANQLFGFTEVKLVPKMNAINNITLETITFNS